MEPDLYCTIYTVNGGAEIMNETNVQIGNRIAQLRKLHGMTQEILAEKLDITIKHISAVERGLSALSMDKMILASDIFDCSLDYMMKGKIAPDYSDLLPKYLIETLSSDDMYEKQLLLEYLNMYQKLHTNHIAFF